MALFQHRLRTGVVEVRVQVPLKQSGLRGARAAASAAGRAILARARALALAKADGPEVGRRTGGRLNLSRPCGLHLEGFSGGYGNW
eukprot:3882606-Alexandrium_andersonii.AAC.1